LPAGLRSWSFPSSARWSGVRPRHCSNQGYGVGCVPKVRSDHTWDQSCEVLANALPSISKRPDRLSVNVVCAVLPEIAPFAVSRNVTPWSSGDLLVHRLNETVRNRRVEFAARNASRHWRSARPASSSLDAVVDECFVDRAIVELDVPIGDAGDEAAALEQVRVVLPRIEPARRP